MTDAVGSQFVGGGTGTWLVSDAPRRMNDAVRSSMYLHYATRMAAAVRAALLTLLTSCPSAFLAPLPTR